MTTVVIVGRPNVGKSTLFNRLVGKRKAITLDTPGITRDPIAETVVWDEQRLRIVDTGGLGGENVIDLAGRVHAHTLQAIRGADAAIVVFDVRAGVGPLDRDTVELIQRCGLPALYVANKADGRVQEDAVVDFCRLGIDVPLPVSAEHANGLGELKEAILELIEPLAAGHGSKETASPGDSAIHVTIVGRPNVGKSSFLNSVAGSDLALVDAQPGTTRDIVDTRVQRAEKSYLLLDTAGMRRPSHVDAGIERLSVGRSVNAIRRADVVLLMVDPIEGMADQDVRIARLAWEAGKALVVAVNKTDLLTRERTVTQIRSEILYRYPTLGVVPIAFLSVKRKRGIEDCFVAVDRAAEARSIEMRTTEVNRVLAAATERRQPPVIAGRRLRLLYAAQTGRRPPTITFFVNRSGVPTDYSRFLERCFREAFPLEGTPLRLRFSRRPSHGSERA